MKERQKGSRKLDWEKETKRKPETGLEEAGVALSLLQSP